MPRYNTPHFLIRKNSLTLDRSHYLLCRIAKSQLENRGFSVEFEKVINISNSKFRLDVYGERNGEIIIYECGHCKQTKLDELRKIFDKVIHMPYLDQWLPKIPEYKLYDKYDRSLVNTKRMAERIK